MIYSASRRSDMVAFRPGDIVDRVRRSRKLEAIVFWTKDIRNLALHKDLRDVLRRWPAVVQFTVTGLAGTAWEPNVPSLEMQRKALEELSGFLPSGAVRWRFDPIVATADWRERFDTVKSMLDRTLGALDEVTVSFPDPYRKAVIRVRERGLSWPETTLAEKKSVLASIVDSFPPGRGNAESPPVRLCCEPDLLEAPGTGQAHCVDGALFDRLYGTGFGDLGKDAGQREACGCMRSTDIGSYEMACPHACAYCYANPAEIYTDFGSELRLRITAGH